jgi:hypothetical protein
MSIFARSTRRFSKDRFEQGIKNQNMLLEETKMLLELNISNK